MKTELRPKLLDGYEQIRADQISALKASIKASERSVFEKAFIIATAPARYFGLVQAKAGLNFLFNETCSTLKGQQTILSAATFFPRLGLDIASKIFKEGHKDITALDSRADTISRTVESMLKDLKTSPELQETLKYTFAKEATGAAEFLLEHLDPNIEKVKQSIPHGNGDPVYIIRGYMVWEGYMNNLAQTLKDHGYNAIKENVSDFDTLETFNSGMSKEKLYQIREEIKAIQDKTGKRVHVIGYSLGGKMAKLVANEIPNSIASVTTLVGVMNPSESIFREKSQMLSCRTENMHGVTSLSDDDHALMADILQNFAKRYPHIPVTRIGSDLDGLVSFQTATGNDNRKNTRNIKINTAHMLAPFSPTYQNAVLATLSGTDFEIVNNRVKLTENASMPKSKPRSKPALLKAV